MFNLSNFLNANKVLLLGLLAAIGTVVQQFIQDGPINYAVMGWAVVVASIAFLANNLHGQVATILSSLLPTVDVIYESTKNNAAISWGHMALLAGVAIVGAITGPAKAVATKTSVIILLVMVGFAAKSQSIFKPLPLYKKPATSYARIVGPTDSLPSLSTGKFNGVRFAGPDLAFAIPDFSVFTGLGLDYVIATADPTTGKWNYNFTIGPRVYGGANLGVPTVQAIGAVGIRATFLNGWLAIGVLYNLTTKKPQATVGNPAALIPGLN